MRKSFSAFLLLTFSSLSFGISFDKDTIDFTNTNNYVWLINNNSSNITVDTIIFIVDSQKTQYFINSNLYIDTAKYDGGTFYRNYRYFVNLIDTIAFAFYRDYGKTVGINNNDSISIKHIRIQDNNYGIPEYTGHNIIDTIKMIFFSSDRSSDSIYAIVNMRYATNIINFNKNVTLRIAKDKLSQKHYLLNGKVIDNKSIQNKKIRIIQH
jgi:hypothetical protein